MGGKKFIIVVLILIGLLVLIELYYPKPVSWQVSLSSDDKVPFGTSVLKESLDDFFPPGAINLSRESFYLMEDSLSQPGSYLIISQNLIQGDEDFLAMMQKIEKGAHLLVSAFHFDNFIQDSLEFKIMDEINKDLYPKGFIPKEDSTYLEVTQPRLNEKFTYRRMDAPYNFELTVEDDWDILMTNEEGKPVAIARDLGSGRLVLSCTPLIFSNYYLLYTNSSEAAAALLSQLPESSLHWTEFYSRGRVEPQTPLRYVLSTAPLKWSYYLTLFAVIAFVIFEAKRKQRPIPIITAPRNESLDFIKTVGNLYYEQNDHKNISEKKIQYLLDHIRTHYHLPTNDIKSPEFLDQVATKSGKPLINIEGLFTMIEILKRKDHVHSDELRNLNDKIEAFLKPN